MTYERFHFIVAWKHMFALQTHAQTRLIVSSEIPQNNFRKNVQNTSKTPPNILYFCSKNEMILNHLGENISKFLL